MQFVAVAEQNTNLRLLKYCHSVLSKPSMYQPFNYSCSTLKFDIFMVLDLKRKPRIATTRAPSCVTLCPRITYSPIVQKQ